MADRLSAEQLAQLSGGHVQTHRVVTFTIDAVDYSDRLLKVGRRRDRIHNRHPNKEGNLATPVMSLKLNNIDGLLSVGNPDGPFPTDQARRDAVIVVTVSMCSPAKIMYFSTLVANSGSSSTDSSMDASPSFS